MQVVKVGNINIGEKSRLVLIAGPCVIESESQCLSVARQIADIASKLDVPYIFKSNFDSG